MNILNGGSHADSDVDIQEFMVVPLGAETFSEGLRWGVEVYHALKSVLKKRASPPAWATKAALRRTCRPTVRHSGPDPGSHQERLHPGQGHRTGPGRGLLRVLHRRRLPVRRQVLTSAEMSAYYTELVADYPLVSIEDPLDENDWDGWKTLTDSIGDKVQLVGDDLVTNLHPAARHRLPQTANLLLVVNQIGSLTETLDAVSLAQRAGYTTITSHRSGETEDTTIADISVATNAGQIKTGALARLSASPSTTSCCASKRNSTTPHATPAAAPSRVSRGSSRVKHSTVAMVERP